MTPANNQYDSKFTVLCGLEALNKSTKSSHPTLKQNIWKIVCIF